MRLSTRVTLATRDFDRLKCIQAVIDGDLKPIRAAERLALAFVRGKVPRLHVAKTVDRLAVPAQAAFFVGERRGYIVHSLPPYLSIV